MSEYYYLDAARVQHGPFSMGEMHVLLDEHRIGQQAAVFRVGGTEWRTASKYPELALRPRPTSSRRSGTSAFSQTWPHQGAPSESDGNNGNPGLFVSGVILTILGISIAVYFFFIYDTSVSVSTEYFPGFGRIGGGSVHNQGLMQNRLIGSIAGMVIAGIGSILLITSHKKGSRADS